MTVPFDHLRNGQPRVYGPVDDRTDAVVDLLIDRAEAAMRTAKSTGAGTVVYDEADAASVVTEQALRDGLGRGEFELHYQPICDIHTRRVVGVEALLRWTHPTLGRVAPDVFIPVAETTGAIVAIGDWVLTTAFAQMAEWHAAGRDLSMSVNVSMVQLADRSLPSRVAEFASAAGLSSREHQVTLEITETSENTRPATLVNVLDGLRAGGFKVSLDDFGTGWSSLARLAELPITGVKIDRSFVAELVSPSPHAQVLVDAIVMIADRLGLSIVAEGVETEQQLVLLDASGVELVQGWLVGRPAPAADLDIG